jgi:hypothetical protein
MKKRDLGIRIGESPARIVRTDRAADERAEAGALGSCLPGVTD